MKKFFFFKSSSSGSGNSQVPPPTDKESNWQSPLENTCSNQSSEKVEHSYRSSNGFFSESQKSTYESHNSSRSPCIRSLSFSSVTFNDNGGLELRNSHCLSNQSSSPLSSSISIPPQQFNSSSRCRSLNSEKQLKAKPYEAGATENAHHQEKPRSAGSSRAHNDSSRNYSLCCSNVSSTVLDLYIDGEQQQESSSPKNISSTRSGSGNGSGRCPPRVQYTAPASPIDDVKGRPRGVRYTAPASPINDVKCRPRSCTFRELIGTQASFSSNDCSEAEFRHELQRKLARHANEKPSQSHVSAKTCLKDFDRDTPITIEEIYSKSLYRCSDITSAWTSHKILPSDEPYETVERYHPKEPFRFQKQNYIFGEDLDSVGHQEDISEELHRKFMEAKERVFFLSEELGQENYLQDRGLDVPDFVQKIRQLTEEQ